MGPGIVTGTRDCLAACFKVCVGFSFLGGPQTNHGHRKRVGVH